jgi:hypothetical protein
MQHCRTRIIVLLTFVTIAIGCQDQASKVQPEQPPSATTQVVQGMVVEAACGECLFELEGDGCDLAVRIDGKAYFVAGTDIDDHGDAHADDGFCNAVRQAHVQGSIENGRFVATSFELLPELLSNDDE